MKRQIALTLFVLTGCQQAPPEQPDFELTGVSETGTRFLIERRTGCLWSIRPDLSGQKLEKEYSTEEFEQFIAETDQLLSDAKKYGLYQVMNVHSPKAEFCNEKFGHGENKQKAELK